MAELLIAWRYIKAKRNEKAISAIATFSIIGIALGVATLIIVTSVMNGFRKEFTDRVIGFNGHLTLYPIESHCDYKTVSVILGHSNISTTLNLYVHPNYEQKKKCIDKMLKSLK